MDMPSMNSSVGTVPSRVWPSTVLLFFVTDSFSNKSPDTFVLPFMGMDRNSSLPTNRLFQGIPFQVVGQNLD